jgi:uncharacterized membrane protein
MAGVVHSILAAVALLLGVGVLCLRKGTQPHRVLGMLYVLSMLGVNITALTIFRVFGGFGAFHVLALINLAVLLTGFGFAFLKRPRHAWLRYHYYFMSWSYVGLCAAAGSELGVRLPGVSFAAGVIVPTVTVTVLGGAWVQLRHGATLARVGRGAGMVVAVLLSMGASPAPVAHDAQVAVLKTLPAELGGSFKYYCVAINPGVLSPPVTKASLIESTQARPDPSTAVLASLKDLSPRFVAASECGRSESDWDVYHRSTKATPAVLVVVGQVEVVSTTRVRVVVFTTSGFLTETYTLYDLERVGSRWKVVASEIVAQA